MIITMKKIALLTDGWKRYVTYAWVHGIRERARELGIDICLYTYNTNGNLSLDEKHNEGEYALYELIDYDAFDGFIYDCSNTSDPYVIASVITRLKAASAPVVSINYYVDGFYYVGNDNRNLIISMVDHMVSFHSCRRLVFAGGPLHNYENAQRVEGFLEALDAHGLSCAEEDILYGDYDYDTGVRYLREWLEAGRELPDVFICANDNIAAGICAEAEKKGLAVPEDFRVTGFDNLDKAAYYKPQIASVDHNRGKIGGRAFDVLLTLMEHRQAPRHTYMRSRIIPAESCGCKNTGTVNYRDYAKWQIDADVERDRHENRILDMEKNFTDCRTLEGLFDRFANYIRAVSCTGMFLCVDRTLLEASPDNTLPADRYDRDRLSVIVGQDRDRHLYSVRTFREMMDYIGAVDEPRSFMFFPVHFRDQRVGTTVLIDPEFLYDYPFFYDVHQAFIDRLHNLYVQTQLENAAARMRRLYNRDALTGLYNRITCDEMIAPRFAAYTREGVVCAIAFFDVDHFKDVNDTYGHDFGDRILVTIARAITSWKPLDAYAYRFGGDEFVVFIPYASEEKVEHFISHVDHELEERGIEISHGVIFTDPDKDDSLGKYLTLADQRMYQAKKERREQKERLGITGIAEKKADVETPFPEITFYKGMDISSLPEKEDRGCVLRDADGTPMEPFALLQKYGINSVRLRLWNEPSNHPESHGYCDLEHTLAMARRIKEHDMHFLLDFHYSDHWADPGKQTKPEAWKHLSGDQLAEAVYDYTQSVLIELSRIDALPDMVQIGNEIRSGMLFPDGAVPDYVTLASLVNAGIKAVRDVSEDIAVMIHLDQGGRFFSLEEWFNAMFSAGMKRIDAIGISYYSFWHGTFRDLKDTITQLIDRYRLPVYVVETAHPWRHCENEHINKDMMIMAGYPAGIEEQKKSLSLVMQVAAEASGDRKTGVYYWEPLGITGQDFDSWDENMGMLDDSGRVLPSFEAFRDFDPKDPPFDGLDTYINSLYQRDEKELPPAGTNLVKNGRFEDGISGWWVNKFPEEVTYSMENGELYVESQSNFTFLLTRDVRIDRAGNYRFMLDYRGSNTTGVSVKMFLKVITCSGETFHEKPIYPSDVDFMTCAMDPVELEPGSIQVGLRIDAPPVYARITNITLVLEEK